MKLQDVRLVTGKPAAAFRGMQGPSHAAGIEKYGIPGAHSGCANLVQDQRFEDRIVWANGLDLAPEFLYERLIDCQNAMATPPG